MEEAGLEGLKLGVLIKALTSLELDVFVGFLLPEEELTTREFVEFLRRLTWDDCGSFLASKQLVDFM